MATRFKLRETTTAPAVSPTLQSYTHNAPATVRRQLLLSDSSALATTAYTPDGADDLAAGDALWCQFVSGPMQSGKLFASGATIKMVMQALEANAANNLFLQLYVAIVDSAGTTVQRVLRSKVLDDNEMNTALRSLFLTTTQDGSDYTTVQGDRLVVELSANGDATASGGTQGHNGSMRFGGGGAGGDLAENDTQTGTTLNPWIEFAPSTLFDENVVPGVLALTTSGPAPTVTATQNVRVTPPVTTLALAPLAPTVTASDHKVVTPPVLALATAAFAPVLAIDRRLTPPTQRFGLNAPTLAFPHDALTATDDFNRADESPIGSPWETLATMDLVSNQMRGQDRGGYWDGNAEWAAEQDADLEVVIELVNPGTVTEAQIGVVGNGPTLSFLDVNNFAAGQAAFYAASTLVGSLAWTPAVGDLLGVRVSRGWVQGWIKAAAGAWTLIGQAYVASYVGDLLTPWLYGYSEGSAIAFDDFRLADYTGTFAPDVQTPILATPGLLALVTTPFAPVIRLAVIPPLAALVTTPFAPDVEVSTGADVTVTPDTAGLTLSTFAPNVTTPRLVTPDLVALQLTTFVPTASTPRTATPGVLALTTSSFVPVVSTPRLVTPTQAALVTATFVPTVQTPVLATPPQLALVLTTFVPGVVGGAGLTVTPGTLALVLSTLAPTVTAPRLATPGTVSLQLTTFAPAAQTPRLATPGVVALATSTFAPTVRLEPRPIPGTASLTTTAFAPTVTSPRTSIPSTLALLLTLYAPNVVIPGDVVPPPASLVLTTFAPNAGVSLELVPGPLGLTLQGLAPRILRPAWPTHDGAIPGGFGGGSGSGSIDAPARRGSFGLTGSAGHRGGLS